MKWATGYRRGRAVPLLLVPIDSAPEQMFLAPAAADAFAEMQARARRDGLELVATSGFRSFHEQRQIHTSRRDPKVSSIKGIAAPPGYSSHQSGNAVDIRTGLTIDAFQSGSTNEINDWLIANAREYGFIRTVQSEPWHFVHLTDSEDRT